MVLKTEWWISAYRRESAGWLAEDGRPLRSPGRGEGTKRIGEPEYDNPHPDLERRSAIQAVPDWGSRP